MHMSEEQVRAVARYVLYSLPQFAQMQLDCWRANALTADSGEVGIVK
jgi:hypothetical protein